ncbi:hypothetical protein Tco_1329875 [Tanacetum coccineum]
MVKESLEDVVLAKESSQPQSSYEAAATLTEFELKKILIDKMDKSESYLAAPEHRECYERLRKSYDLDKTFFATYEKVYSLKRSRKDKDKDEDPSAGSDRGLKKMKTSKDAEPTKEEPEFEVVDSDMPQDQEENQGNDDVEPKEKTPQQGQNQSWLITLASSIEKSSKSFDELISTLIDFSAFKTTHVIASGSSRNSSKESYGSNDMAHNYYLEDAKKKTQDKNMNLKPSVMHTTSLQNTTNGSKPKPRSNNHTSRSLPVSKSSCGMSNGVPLVDHSRNSRSFSDSKHFVCSTCQKCVFNANHDACLTKFLKEVNSRIKVQSPKTINNIKPVEKINNVIKPKRWISKGYRISPNKSSAVHEKPNTPRSCLRRKPTSRIFKTVGLRWIPTVKMFTDSTTMVDSEPPNGSNENITNPYECKQTLNVSAGTLNLNAGTPFNPKKERYRVWLLKKLMSKNQVPQGIHKQKQSPNSSQCVKEQQKRAHFDDPCHELLHRVYISQGSSLNVHK